MYWGRGSGGAWAAEPIPAATQAPVLLDVATGSLWVSLALSVAGREVLPEPQELWLIHAGLGPQ